MRRSGWAIRAQGSLSRRADREALRRLANARQAGGLVAARAESAAADEPTNFLDLRTQILLEHFLRNFSEACLIVSHDRAFLSATCTHTLDLSRGKLTMFPGKIDAFLEYQRERREHDERVNATVMAKRRQLEEFIAKNKARASTATQAQSKSKQLERLQLNEIAFDEPTAKIPPPVVEPRQGPALRCRDLAIGYDESNRRRRNHAGNRTRLAGRHRRRQRSGQNDVSSQHGRFAACPAGEVRWGYGCEIGVYAQHVYTSLPEKQTVLEYLEATAAPGDQDPEHPRPGRRDAVPRRPGQEENLGAVRRRTGPAVHGRLCC